MTRNLPPLLGGMERLVSHIAQLLSRDYVLSVIGPAGCSTFLPPGVTATEIAPQPIWRFLVTCAVEAWRQARRHAPQLVLAGSGLTAPFAWFAARISGAQFVLYLHGLDVIAPSRIYQSLWLPFIRRADLVLVNSRNTRRLAIERGVAEDAIRILHPGTEQPGPDAHSAKEFRALQNLHARPVMLSIGRLTPRKGLAEFIRHALPKIVQQHPDAVLLVIGADAGDAVRAAAGSERGRIVAAAKESGVAEVVRLLPPCDDAVLSAAYRAADVHVFPVIDLPGDIEGFGMVAIEAAAHGLPTVGFAVGGVADAIVAEESGSLVASGDYDGFAAQVLHWLAQRQDSQVEVQCRAAAADFSWDRFDQRLREFLAEYRA